MKPSLTTCLTPMTYWACANPNHHHRTESIAAVCIEKQKAIDKRKAAGPLPHQGEAGHAMLLAELRSGTKQAELARKYGISPSRVGTIVAAAIRREPIDDRSGQLSSLRSGTRNFLLSKNLDSFEKIKDALISGGLKKMNRFKLHEITEWVSLAETTDTV